MNGKTVKKGVTAGNGVAGRRRQGRRAVAMAGGATVMQRPGGRTERNRRAVAKAVLGFIREGRLDFELQEVAAKAGVHRTTLFRRWPTREALIGEAMGEHVSQLDIRLSGDWRADLRHIAFAMRDFLSEPVEMAMNRMLAMTDNEVFREQMFAHWRPIIDIFRDPIERGKAAGEVADDLDTGAIVLMLTSGIVVNAVLLRVALTDRYLNHVVDLIIRCCEKP